MRIDIIPWHTGSLDAKKRARVFVREAQATSVHASLLRLFEQQAVSSIVDREPQRLLRDLHDHPVGRNHDRVRIRIDLRRNVIAP